MFSRIKALFGDEKELFPAVEGRLKGQKRIIYIPVSDTGEEKPVIATEAFVKQQGGGGGGEKFTEWLPLTPEDLISGSLTLRPEMNGKILTFSYQSKIAGNYPLDLSYITGDFECVFVNLNKNPRDSYLTLKPLASSGLIHSFGQSFPYGTWTHMRYYKSKGICVFQ